MKQHAGLFFAVLNGGIQGFGFINAFFLNLKKRILVSQNTGADILSAKLMVSLNKSG